MNLLEKVNRYFETVTDEQLLDDLREAGFIIVPKALTLRVEKTYSTNYSPVSMHYFADRYSRAFSLENGRVA